MEPEGLLPCLQEPAVCEITWENGVESDRPQTYNTTHALCTLDN